MTELNPEALKQSDDPHPITKPWPDPTPEMLNGPIFNAIWGCIKSWDINVPHAYDGYCGATGNHVRAILDALSALPAEQKREGWKPIESAPKDGKHILVGFQGQFAWLCFVAPAFGSQTNQAGYAPPTHWMPLPAAPEPKP